MWLKTWRLTEVQRVSAKRHEVSAYMSVLCLQLIMLPEACSLSE